MTLKGSLIASAVAGLFAMGATSAFAADKDGGDQVNCDGINACKGQGSCGGPDHGCAGQERLQGPGLDQDVQRKDCLAKGGKVVEANERREGRQEVTEAVMTLGLPHLGHGIGLRASITPRSFVESAPRLVRGHHARTSWSAGGNPRRVLRAGARALSGGAARRLAVDRRLRRPLDERISTSSPRSPTRSSRRGSRITCAGRSVGGKNGHDLLPLPVHRGGARPRGGARRAGAGAARAAHPARERRRATSRSAIDD